MIRVDVGDEPICLIHAEDDQFYAISDTCTHENYSLCEGELWEMSVECPRHGSRFDARTGKVRPARRDPGQDVSGDRYQRRRLPGRRGVELM